MNNKARIIKYIKDKGLITPKEVREYIGIGGPMVHRYLKKLLEEKVLEKKGLAPKVYYVLKTKQTLEETTENFNINNKDKGIIEENFTFLKPNGEEITGFRGFTEWCRERDFNIEKKAIEYVETLTTYEGFKRNKTIDATSKLDMTFTEDEKFLNNLYYLHPYSLPIFGKTKIATWLFHAKQTQNSLLMKRVFDIVIPEILEFIKREKPSAIGFIPPTVPRNIQIMKELQKRIATNLPVIKIEKIKTPIMVQQKSLKEIRDRILNAEDTMVIPHIPYSYKKVLIIDDFTGSGATLNVIAKKIKQQKISQKVIGLTITGSMNGFEIIREI